MSRIAEITLSVEPYLIYPSELDIKHSAMSGVRERRTSGLDGKILDPNNRARRLITITIHEGEKTRISIPRSNTTATFVNSEEGVNVAIVDQMADSSHYPKKAGWEIETGTKGKLNTARRVIQDTSKITIFTDSLAQISLTVAEVAEQE